MYFVVPLVLLHSMLFPLTVGAVDVTVLEGVTFCTGFLGLGQSSYMCLGLPNDEFKGVGSDLEVARVVREGDP